MDDYFDFDNDGELDIFEKASSDEFEYEMDYGDEDEQRSIYDDDDDWDDDDDYTSSGSLYKSTYIPAYSGTARSNTTVRVIQPKVNSDVSDSNLKNLMSAAEGKPVTQMMNEEKNEYVNIKTEGSNKSEQNNTKWSDKEKIVIAIIILVTILGWIGIFLDNSDVEYYSKGLTIGQRHKIEKMIEEECTAYGLYNIHSICYKSSMQIGRENAVYRGYNITAYTDDPKWARFNKVENEIEKQAKTIYKRGILIFDLKVYYDGDSDIADGEPREIEPSAFTVKKYYSSSTSKQESKTTDPKAETEAKSTYKPQYNPPKDDDPYNAKDYFDLDSFYEDNYDEFFDWDDAEDYYRDHNPDGIYY